MRIPLLCTAVLSAMALAGLPGCSDDRDASGGRPRMVPPLHRPTLSFYKIPRCFLCEELSQILEVQEREHRSEMNFRTVDYHLPASQEAIHRFQLGSHGIVINDAQGNQLRRLAAHQQDGTALTKAIEEVLTNLAQARKTSR